MLDDFLRRLLPSTTFFSFCHLQLSILKQIRPRFPNNQKGLGLFVSIYWGYIQKEKS